MSVSMRLLRVCIAKPTFFHASWGQFIMMETQVTEGEFQPQLCGEWLSIRFLPQSLQSSKSEARIRTHDRTDVEVKQKESVYTLTFRIVNILLSTSSKKNFLGFIVRWGQTEERRRGFLPFPFTPCYSTFGTLEARSGLVEIVHRQRLVVSGDTKDFQMLCNTVTELLHPDNQRALEAIEV